MRVKIAIGVHVYVKLRVGSVVDLLVVLRIELAITGLLFVR